ncbi:MAG: PilZ domain-containing protein [Oscillospiraceae bacterium]|nr:PilZ domain-containing protein [Oscillospiraceae bacterium]
MAGKYLILDSCGNAVARGTSEHDPVGNVWKLHIEDGDVQQVMSHACISLVGDSEAVPALEGKVLRWEGDTVFLEPIRPLGEAVRKNLRIPVRFVSYLYPVSGHWRGRVPIVSRDLSCGGLAFFCPRPLEIGETAQVVIPVTAQPLVLTLRILRIQSTREGETFYAARFIDLLREEESMVREAVFNLQLKNS